MKSRIWRMAGVSVLCLSISVQVLADQQSDQLERQKQQLQQQQEQMEKMEHERQKQEEQRRAEARDAQQKQAKMEYDRKREEQRRQEMERSLKFKAARDAGQAEMDERKRQEAVAFQQKMAAQQLQRIADYNQHQFEKKLRKKEKEQDEQLEAQQRQLDYQQAQAEQAESAFLPESEQRDEAQSAPEESSPPEQPTVLNTQYDLGFYQTKNQSPEQKQKDGYECHMWAVRFTSFSPETALYKPAPEVVRGYQRSMGGCLYSRGYNVNFFEVGG
jgi:hypothetical protein